LFLNIRYISHTCAGILLCCQQAGAQPSLASMQVLAEQKIYKDVKLPNVFYYMPADYKLVTNTAGKPEFTLLQMRYTGTRAGGDQQTIKFNNLLQFHVSVDETYANKMSALRAAVKKINAAADLRLMPVKKFSSVLVFAGTTAGSPDSLQLIKTSYAEAVDENASVNSSYWNDRIINIRLNDNDAQIVESALRNHQSVMSFSYAMYTVFSEMDMSDVNVTGDKNMADQVRNYFADEIKNQRDSSLHITLLKADAISISPDLDKWPALIQKIDINEKMPARYALFDVYCYDFNNNLRPDLYAKKIEIKATSVNGSEITTAFSFKGSQPDIYAKSIRFPYAVKFDKPFYYRVTEINKDGDASSTEWKEKKEWSEILDITSTPDKIIIKTPDSDQ
jgi:hypothetical protein